MTRSNGPSQLSRFSDRCRPLNVVPAENKRRCHALRTLPTLLVTCEPRDDTFLELAVAGPGDVIVTGDSALLALGPLESIAILTPARFLTTQPE